MPAEPGEASRSAVKVARGRSCSSRHLSTGRGRGRISSLTLEYISKLVEAAREAAGDRPGREAQRVPDSAVALVAGEEAVEDLLAVLRQLGHRVVHVEGVLERGQHVLGGQLGQLVDVGVR